jgi:DNA-binding NtrC family response regulator
VSPLSYEEVMALRALADHLGAATGASAQLARARGRELEATHTVSQAQQQIEELQGQLAHHAARQRTLAETTARPARVASYSPAARSALVEAERLAASDAPVALLAGPGVDAVSWAALIHLASARRDGLLLVVDATVSEEQPLTRWADVERSPLTIARGGTLVVVDAHALPVDTQRYLGSAPRRDTGLVLVLPLRGEAGPSLEDRLADRIGDRTLRLPRLVERAEDLRALAFEKLTRIGTRLRGKPYGLSLRAQELLNEHDWPGNEAELDAVLLRAALACDGDVVDHELLATTIGLHFEEPEKRAIIGR